MTDKTSDICLQRRWLNDYEDQFRERSRSDTMTVKTYPTVITNNLRQLPGALPAGNIPNNVDPISVAAECLLYLQDLRAEYFCTDAIWRDSFAMTGTMRTFFSKTNVITAWREVSLHHAPTDFQLDEQSWSIERAGTDSSWLDVGFSFRTNGTLASRCSGFLSLVWSPASGWNIWVIRTILEQFLGYSHVDDLKDSAIRHDRCTVEDTFKPPGDKSKTHYECIVFGGGQSGLSTGGRLQALGVDYLVLEKQGNVGDSWKSRYDAARCESSSIQFCMMTANTSHSARLKAFRFVQNTLSSSQ
jgi:hypothetical protein